MMSDKEVLREFFVLSSTPEEEGHEFVTWDNGPRFFTSMSRTPQVATPPNVALALLEFSMNFVPEFDAYDEVLTHFRKRGKPITATYTHTDLPFIPEGVMLCKTYPKYIGIRKKLDHAEGRALVLFGLSYLAMCVAS